MRNFSHHPSILKVKDYVKITHKFYFKTPLDHEFQTQINTLVPKNAAVENDIPAKILMETNEISSIFLTKMYNDSIDDQIFPGILKNADVIPIHKKVERTIKENYCPVSLLPLISKLFGRDMCNLILSFIEKHLSLYIFGFREGHCTEQCLNVMIERWKKVLDETKCVGAVLTDLSKAFDCLNHELLYSEARRIWI